MSYESGFQTGLAGLMAVNNGFEDGRQRKRQQEGDAMVRQRYADQQAQQSQQDGVQKLGRVAAYLLAIPDPQQRAAAYSQALPTIGPIAQSLGLPPAPQVWDESHLPELQMLAQIGGQGGASDKPMNVSPGGEIVDPRTGRVIHSNQNFAPQRPTYDSARGGWVIPPGDGPSVPAAAPAPGTNDAILAQANFMAQNGVPDAKIQEWLSQQPGITPIAGGGGGGASGAGFIPVAPPKPDYEAERLRIAQEANARAAQAAADAAEVRKRAAWGTAPAGQRFNAQGVLEPIPGYAPANATKPNESAAAMAQDAINYAAAVLGKSPQDVAEMTPEQIRDDIKAAGDTWGGSRWSSGPIASKVGIPFTNINAGTLANADLEAYANSAAGKKARLNNPTGPVSNADFEIGRKSVFSPEKPDSVNADLIYEALTWKRRNAPAKVEWVRGPDGKLRRK